MLLRELFYNTKKPLVEGGGNIWPETEHFLPTPDMVKALVSQVNKYVHKAGLPLYLSGSSANEDPNPEHETGDVDLMVDMDQVKQFFKIPNTGNLSKDDKAAREALEAFLIDAGVETYKAGVTVHIKFPYKGKAYQADIKVVRKAQRVSRFHQHKIPRGSPYKGVHKQMLMNALASSQGLLWSPDEGLYRRDAQGKKADLISDEWDDIAKVLLGNRNATGNDLDSVEAIMNAIPDPARRQQIYTLASGGQSWQKAPMRGPERNFFEAAAPAVGRKYQHIEDLVFTNGSAGGLHAIERLRGMGTQGGSIELKWDGSPVVYWGRDEAGKFRMFPKNAWEYLKRGATTTANGVNTMLDSPEDVESFLLNTGKAQPGKEKQRQVFAKQMASLWPYFEKVSPPKGFIEGGILFSPLNPPKLNPKTNDWDFTPNVTSFHIPVDSELGQQIKSAKLMVAATGYYDQIGGEEDRFPNATELSTRDVIVQGTTYVQEPAGVDTSGLDEIEAYITENAELIDSFVAGQPGLSKPGAILYKFFNQHLRIAGVKAKFAEWVRANASASQAQKVLSHPGLDKTLTAVELLTREKMKLIQSLSAGTHGGIRQTKPEGYVQAHPGGKFKYDLPGQFVKTIDQANWAPRKD